MPVVMKSNQTLQLNRKMSHANKLKKEGKIKTKTRKIKKTDINICYI